MVKHADIWNKREFGLPTGTADLREVREAVSREEYASAKTMKLRASDVEDLGNGLYRIEMSGSPPTHWQWESAQAFKIAEIDGEPDWENRIWQCEVTSISKDESSIFVASSDPENPPCRGEFHLKPFNFLRALRTVIEEPHLNAFCGDELRSLMSNTVALSGGKQRAVAGNQPLIHKPLWGHSWSAIWGPPGTGKTEQIGNMMATRPDNERILVVSTTNQATDEVAIRSGEKILEQRRSIRGVVRAGSGANLIAFQNATLHDMVKDGQAEIHHQIRQLTAAANRETEPNNEARLRKQIHDLRKALQGSTAAYTDPQVRVVFATAYGAISALSNESIMAKVSKGEAPFTTVIIDEAGLISCATAGVLALLASRRVVLVGDPKQLSPISQAYRTLPKAVGRWLATSGLEPLRATQTRQNVLPLWEQHRMAPAICNLVSAYQYDKKLRSSPRIEKATPQRPASWGSISQAIWYDLDADLTAKDLLSAHAKRGPGGRSWERKCSEKVLGKLLRNHFMNQSQMEKSNTRGLFITPFRAQANRINRWFRLNGHRNWSASTVHAQQGAQAEWVIFDTVHASSRGFPVDEWKRLVNVAMSRAKEQLFIIASRQEMMQPFLRPIFDALPRGSRMHMHRGKWVRDTAFNVRAYDVEQPHRPQPTNLSGLGAKIYHLESKRVRNSYEQEILSSRKMDGKPRIVRGVAGSGKSWVLSHWLCRTLVSDHFTEDPDRVAWVVFANLALGRHLEGMAHRHWRRLYGSQLEFPADKVRFLHLKKDILVPDMLTAGLRRPADNDFKFNDMAQALIHCRRDPQPRCDAMFIDEAQDFGAAALEYCFSLVHGTSIVAGNKPVMVFYDNAQNVYSRKTPVWTNLGLNIKGRRSTVMKESFRSTRPIMEFAVNFAAKFRSPQHPDDKDSQELINRGLLTQSIRSDMEWWDVGYAKEKGDIPAFRAYENRREEAQQVASRIRNWITKEDVCPGDIKVIGIGKARDKVEYELRRQLNGVCEVVKRTSEGFSREPGILYVTTPHSFKGYECEIAMVVGADAFWGDGGIETLYVAMTRGRTILEVSGVRCNGGRSKQIMRALSTVANQIRASGPPPNEMPKGKEWIDELIDRAPIEFVTLISNLKNKADDIQLNNEPICADDGSTIAEPDFVFTNDDGQKTAVFFDPIDEATKTKLAQKGYLLPRSTTTTHSRLADADGT